MRAARWVAAPLGALLLTAVAPAWALPRDPLATVDLALSVTDARALDALVHATTLDRHDRAARLAALVPDRARRASVAAVAGRLGLDVAASSTWTVELTGPAARVRGLFGDPSAGPDGLAHGYARVPAALAPYAVAAFPTTGRVARPLDVQGLEGSDFHTAYSAPDGQPPAGAAPLTIASIQLSGWHAGDLSTYAQAAGLPDPIAAGRYTPVPVDHASPARTDGAGGDQEVALDQEAILSSAPYANQRVYFAPNGTSGFWDAIHQVGTDAAAYRTAALTTSWGGCEYVDPANPTPDRTFYAAMDQALKYAVAAGVTVFAATGDSGSTDCLGQISGSAQWEPAVDFPASSPYVVAVGGTNLPDPANPATARAWAHSGGGESQLEPLPAFQSSLRPLSRTGGRLVPDIASDADPGTGFDVFDSLQGGWLGPVGGTSLAAPTQTALFVDTLTAGGYQSGIGDIHDALYGARAPAFTDITRGSNGDYSAGPGYDKVTGRGTPVWSTLVASLAGFRLRAPAATATRGIDLRATLPSGLSYRGWSQPVVDSAPACAVTSSSPPTAVTLPRGEGWHTVAVAGIDRSSANGGAGTCHISTARVLLDRHRPRVVAAAAVGGPARARASWSFTDAAPSSGLLHYVVRITSARGTLWAATTTATSHVFDPSGAHAFAVTVTAYDRAGNNRTSVAHLVDDGALRYSSGWRLERSTVAFGGGVHGTTSSGASAKVSTRARRVTLYVTTCSHCGVLAVYDGAGHLVRRINTYSARRHYRVAVTILAGTATAARTFVVRAVHRRDHRSRGYDVGLDGLATAA